MLSLHFANRQKRLKIDRRRMRRAVESILSDANVADAQISVAIVDDSTIAKLHKQFMDDPTPTDVLSFVLERSKTALEGEIVASADTAARCAARFRMTADEELLLYVIHGTLHLVGYDDTTPEKRKTMRKMEKKYLKNKNRPRS